MMNRIVVVSAMLIVLAASTIVSAQTKPNNRGAGSPGLDTNLLQMDQVQKELQLTDEQRAKLLMVGMQMLQSGKRGNLEKQVSAILKPEQRQRLKEIRMQLDGVNAMLSPKVSKELNLSADQLAKLRAIQTVARPAQAEKNASPEQRYLKVIAMRKEATTQALKILTPEQRAQFEKMQGKKVEFDLPASSVSKPKAQ
ncbi:MAG: hypothetical protein ABFC77_06105 [Thermoguttaceae bacterium]